MVRIWARLKSCPWKKLQQWKMPWQPPRYLKLHLKSHLKQRQRHPLPKSSLQSFGLAFVIRLIASIALYFMRHDLFNANELWQNLLLTTVVYYVNFRWEINSDASISGNDQRLARQDRRGNDGL
jgi:hypothetical protein